MGIEALLPIIWKVVEILAVTVITPLLISYIKKNIDQVQDTRIQEAALTAVAMAEEFAASEKIEPEQKYSYAKRYLQSAFPKLSDEVVEVIIHATLTIASMGASSKPSPHPHEESD